MIPVKLMHPVERATFIVLSMLKLGTSSNYEFVAQTDNQKHLLSKDEVIWLLDSIDTNPVEFYGEIKAADLGFCG